MHARQIAMALLALLPFFVFAQNGQALEKTSLHNNKTFEDEFGYVQAVKVDNVIYVSGIAAKGEMNEAIGKVYDRLEKILSSYNLTFRNVVRETIFTTRFDELVNNKEVRKKYYSGDYPASTWVQIERLYSPEAVIEIDFIVVSGNQDARKKD